MSDGQDKSDDLIAELAKLMASTAGGSEAEAKPAPKLVSEAPRPVVPTIRIPGMDAPVSAAPTPAQPVPVYRPAPASPNVVRIPGMDQPTAAVPAPVRVPVAPPPAAAAPVVAPAEAKPAETKPAASFDFGTLPAATSLKPEPMSNWQDREIPKPVSTKPMALEPVAPPLPPVVVAEPKPVDVKPAMPAAEFRPAAPAVDSVPHRHEPSFEAPKPAASGLAAEPIVASARPAPAGDSFDFDFGFSAEVPPPPLVDARPAPRPVTPRVSSGDPIADLIAADLDDADHSEPPATPVPAIVRPAMQAPVVRNVAPPGAPPPQRPVATVPARPQSTPVAAPSTHKSAEERFAPVFGVGSRSTAQPQPDLDPMDEIESLIGEAVRVELSAPERPAAPAASLSAPVVPPLTNGFAPRRAAIKETDTHATSAEAAILAAAAASGAEIGRIDGGMVGEASPYKRPRAKPERRSLFAGGMRQYVGMAVAGTLLLAAGFGLYWVLGMGRGNDAEAPVLSADATPAKETAPAPVAAADTQGSVVFNELDGNSAAPTDEQLVSRDVSAETSVADVARTVGDEGADAASESELANRKVRTVTVRPDGTIVSGDDAVAGSEALPVDRPNVPDLPGEDVQPSELLAAVPTNDATADPIAAAIATTTDPAATADGQLATLVTPDSAATIDPSIVAPIPAGRPSDRSVLGGGANQRAAAVEATAPLDLVPAGGNDTPAAPVLAAGGAYVQLSSQRSEGDAQASLRTTQNRLSGLLGGQSLEIRRVDLGAKGIWYRVVLPTGSFQQATQACASFKANGADCVAING